MPINSGYSFYEYAGDGVTTRFPVQFSLGELKRAYVTCRVDNEVDAFGAPLYRALADVPGDPGMIEVLGDVPGVGVPIVFRRIVPKELLLHLYANGSILDYPSLDESHLQLMMALHEVLDGYGLTNVFTDINMNGYKLTNIFTDPDDPTSIATIGALGPYRQDALDAAIAAAASAITAEASSVTAQAQVALASAQADDAEGFADAAALSAIAASGFADDAEQSAIDAEATVSGLDARVDVLEIDVPLLHSDVLALQTDKLNKDENINLGAAYTIIGNETAIEFGSTLDPIPAGVKRIIIMLNGISTNGASNYRILLGNGSFVTTGYKITSFLIGSSQSGAVFTNGIILASSGAANIVQGSIALQRVDGNLWVIEGGVGLSNTGIGLLVIGTLQLSSVLDRIRITTVNGTDLFDAGTINISWEF